VALKSEILATKHTGFIEHINNMLQSCNVFNADV